jgi:membrane-associated phospholipid phosphatase
LLNRLDIGLLRVLRCRAHHPAIERAAVRYSRLGEHSHLWFAIGASGAAFDTGHRHTYLRLVRALVWVEVSNALLKRVFRRPRPELDGLPALVVPRSPLSYPSAHAATSFAAARLLSEPLPATCVYGLAAAMAISRPYLGLHYPSDILAGALLGTAMADLLSPAPA